MTGESGEQHQRRYREFLDLLPLTLALAGLPPSEIGKYFREDQIEGRVFTLRHAYRAARQFARDVVQGSTTAGNVGGGTGGGTV